jgi:hypothetical protein
MHFREATKHDVEGILYLYKVVAAVPGGIARLQDEITDQYVYLTFCRRACRTA